MLPKIRAFSAERGRRVHAEHHRSCKETPPGLSHDCTGVWIAVHGTNSMSRFPWLLIIRSWDICVPSSDCVRLLFSIFFLMYTLCKCSRFCQGRRWFLPAKESCEFFLPGVVEIHVTGIRNSLQMPGFSHSYLTVTQYFNVVYVFKCGVFLLNKDKDK